MAKNKLVVPFLKWVGGKRQLISEIKELLPKRRRNLTYYEPFIGGGALLFDLQPKRAIINDYNEELINVYRIIRDYPYELIEDLKRHENTAEYFYKLRAIDRSPAFSNLTNIQRASRIIYLNKTCYNGLYRVNNAGEFNSPFGKYKNPNIVNAPVIKAVSKYLKTNDIQISRRLRILSKQYLSKFFRISRPSLSPYIRQFKLYRIYSGGVDRRRPS